MPTAIRPGHRTITAFLDGPDTMDIRNVIHATDGAKEYGYKAALVGGVTVYGWAAPAILQAFGEEWLEYRLGRRLLPEARLSRRRDDGRRDAGWRWHRQPGDEEPGRCRLRQCNAWPGHARLRERIRAAVAPDRGTGAARPATADDAISAGWRGPATYGRALYARRRKSLCRRQATRPRPALVRARRLHPSRLDGGADDPADPPQLPLRSRHPRPQPDPEPGPARLDQVVAVCGHFLQTYERKGHHYAVIDGVILGEDGSELCNIRHTTIFEVAKRG